MARNLIRTATAALEVSVNLSATFEVALDLWPSWLHEAVRAMLEAEGHTRELWAAWDDGGDWGVPMRYELEASMRATVAAACAFESYCDLVRTSSGSAKPDADSAAGRIVETLSSDLVLADRDVAHLRQTVSELFQRRNDSVHHETGFRTPIKRPDRPGEVFHPYRVKFSGLAASQRIRSSVRCFSTLVASMDAAPSDGVREVAARSQGHLESDLFGSPEGQRLMSSKRLIPPARRRPTG